jgi:diacylglycerol kinase family enzyme
VQFGILPCGSGNGLAFSAGIPKNIEKALEIIFMGNAHTTDAFEINGKFACMLCGVGYDAQVAHDFANDPNRGLITYIKKSIENFFIAEAYPFIIDINGNELLINAYFISIANSNQYGNNFTIAPKASLTDGLLDVVIVTKQHKLSLLIQTFKQVAGLNKLQEIDVINNEASVIYFQTEKLTIINKEGAPLHIDGDPAESFEKMEINVLKDCFRLIYP